MTNKKLGAMLIALIMIVVGFLLVLHPGNALQTVFRILAIGLFLTGLVGIIGYFRHRGSMYDLLIAAVELIVAIIILVHRNFAINVYPVIVGIMILLDGIGNLLTAFSMKKENNSSWKFALGISLIALVFGLVILFNPFTTAQVMVAVTGIALIYEGAVRLIVGLKKA